ncbi:MAG: histidinol-phosphatase [Clostridia bacterium]|nr:histidinol-phosphatase [Clostridia bacterium]
MIVSTYHTHSTFSDGKNSLEEMVLAAIEAGMPELGFSDHAPMSFRCNWSLRAERLEEYKKEVKRLKEKYKDQIKIYLGIEQDYYSIPAEGYEYILGSVHYIYKDGVYLELDKSAETTRENIEKHYGGDGVAYAVDYFKLVKDVVKVTNCQIIGHFDLVTKFNEKMPMIDTTDPRYIQAYTEAIEELLKTDAIFEINTGAISRGYRTSPYPSEKIIDLIAKGKKPFAICSDTHSVDSIATNLELEREKLEKKGYTYIKSLTEILGK